MIGLQVEKGELIDAEHFKSNKNYVLHLIHCKAYEKATEFTRDKKVLDLGCNTGYGSRIIKNSCKEIVGVDVSDKAIEMANNLHGKENIKFRVIDGKELPFSENTFDVVVSFQVIEHIVNEQEYFAEIKRVLVPGGKIIFTTPNRLIRLYPGMKPWNEFHVREYGAFELKELLDVYFQKAEIYGLYAREPLYSIELSRVHGIRDRAKLKQDPRINPVVKGAILFAMNLRSSVKKRLVPEERNFQETYSTADFFYRSGNLDDALDLMAVCTN
jgi:2-polyprenyl-3-methyl-5-hydroxy-6-metoxy-1,4-benzoquinol methylase